MKSKKRSLQQIAFVGGSLLVTVLFFQNCARGSFGVAENQEGSVFVASTNSSCLELEKAKQECQKINSADSTACRILDSTSGNVLYFLSGFGPAWEIGVNCPSVENSETPIVSGGSSSSSGGSSSSSGGSSSSSGGAANSGGSSSGVSVPVSTGSSSQGTCTALENAKRECSKVNAADSSACRVLEATSKEELYFVGGFGPAWEITVSCPGFVGTPTGSPVSGGGTTNETPVSGGGSAPVVSPVTTSSCVSNSKLVCVDTQLPFTPFGRVTYRPYPDVVYAFKINVPVTGTYYGSASATRMVSSDTAKLLVISETPGDISIAGKDSGCVAQGTEVTAINFKYNDDNANPWIYCRLKAGKTYYINASSYSKWTAGKQTCSDPATCGFYFTGR